MNGSPLVLDEFDHKLLELLQQDASVTLSELGEAVGLSPSA
ncbi:MAG: AsnC family protein, partial [Lysobacter sp.]|nr:AsnC family protein [Lysobacter sp.]